MSLPERLQKYSEPQKVLDHGHVRLVDVMGDDSSIVQAARVSYGNGTKTVREDRGLIRYLMRHAHTSPVEMCEIKLHIKMPIFVARQWIRHRTASVNEVSARYSEMADEFYVPEMERIQEQSKDNKQGSGETLPLDVAAGLQALMKDAGVITYNGYQQALGHNLAREIARTVLPVSLYTEMYWKIDLHNLLHFLRLRMDPHAQYEIRVFADKIAEIVQAWVPHTWEAFLDYRVNAVTFTESEMKGLKAMVDFLSTSREILCPTDLTPEGLEQFKAKVESEIRLYHESTATIPVMPQEDSALETAIKGSGLKGREKDEFLAKLTKILG